jgi:hypothetical protein
MASKVRGMQRLGVRITTMTCALAIGLLCGFSVEAMPVRGGELRVRRSDVAADCPDEAELSAALAAIEGSAPLEPDSPISVEVELDRDGAGYVARIRVSGTKSGERELRDSGDDCTPLAYAISVALAILFDSSLEQAEASPLRVPPLPAPGAVRPAKAEAREQPIRREGAVPAASPREHWPTASLAVRVGLGAGVLGYAITGQLGVSLRLRTSRRWELSVGGFWAPGRDLPHGSGVGSVQLLAGRAELTATLAEAPPGRLAVSAGLASGALKGAGLGYDHDYEASAFWLAPAVGAVGSWRLASGGALSLSTTLLVPHRAHRFRVAHVPGAAFESAPAAALLELGAELSLL